jgi:hypothetical protein
LLPVSDLLPKVFKEPCTFPLTNGANQGRFLHQVLYIAIHIITKDHISCNHKARWRFPIDFLMRSAKKYHNYFPAHNSIRNAFPSKI